MINRIIGGLILLIGLTSVHAQSELSVIREPNAVENCKDETSIIPTCLFSRKAARTPAEMITNDLGVCSCMKKSNYLFQDSQQTPIPKDELEREKQRKLTNLNQTAGNNSVLQASSSSKSKKEQDISLMVYGGQETRAKTKTKPGPLISNNLTKINSITDENKAWQCVTYQEYSLQRELPSDNDFFSLLTERNFKAEDWNVNSLAAKYDAASDKDKNIIRLKMSFLSRNPIFQTLMKAEATDKIPADKILAKQTELYGILRNLAPAENSTCTQVPNKCFQELLSNGKYQQYTDGVARYLMDFDVIDIASSQAATDYAKELKRITESGEQSTVGSVPTDPEGYFNYLQTANQQLLRECAGDKVKPECYTKFSGHCTHIDAIDQRVREGIKLKGGEISSILREEESVHATLDPNKNESFKAFNEKICLDPYQNASGEKLNYFQYAQKYCSGDQKIPECSDRKALLTKFLNDYNVGEVEADRSLRTAFSKIITDRKFQDISAAQVLAANNISETPAELRARFGGSFPSITPSGTLVPPGPSAPQLASGSGVSSVIPDYSDVFTNSPAKKSSSSFQKASFDNETTSSNYQATSNKPLPELNVPKINTPAIAGNTSRSLPSSIRTPASDEISSESSEEADRPRSRGKNSPTETKKDPTEVQSSSGSGSGGGGRAPSRSVSSSSGSVTTEQGEYIDLTLGGGPVRKRGPRAPNYLFKYGLDEKNQPEVSLVNPTEQTEIKVTVDSRILDRIKSNPNSFEVGKEDLDMIMANPDQEVKLIIGAKDGNQELVVYARKDSTGGVSFGLNPSKNKSQAKADVMRINVASEVHESIVKDPDVYLNQNPTIMEQVLTQEGKNKKLLLQVVSPGKRALIYEVKKKSEYIYTFKRVGP